jgi:hypothetical protein
LSLLHLAKCRQVNTILRLEEEDDDGEDSNRAASPSPLAANLRLVSDLCLTFTNLRSGRSKEVTGHLAIANRSAQFSPHIFQDLKFFVFF